MSEPTVRYHLRQLFEKVGCKSREELIIFAFRSGLDADFFEDYEN
jgi:DNA-binding CsgD family transcriptional regulator